MQTAGDQGQAGPSTWCPRSAYYGPVQTAGDQGQAGPSGTGPSPGYDTPQGLFEKGLLVMRLLEKDSLLDCLLTKVQGLPQQHLVSQISQL